MGMVILIEGHFMKVTESKFRRTLTFLKIKKGSYPGGSYFQGGVLGLSSPERRILTGE